jgi:hypothetical protein
MSYKVSFQERSKLGMEKLSQQRLVSLQEAREQAQWLKKVSATKLKKLKD